MGVETVDVVAADEGGEAHEDRREAPGVGVTAVATDVHDPAGNSDRLDRHHVAPGVEDDRRVVDIAKRRRHLEPRPGAEERPGHAEHRRVGDEGRRGLPQRERRGNLGALLILLDELAGLVEHVRADGAVEREVRQAAAELKPLAPASGPTSIDQLLANNTQGLPTTALPESVPFRPRLSLEHVGQEFGVSTGGTGPFLSGGIGLRFTDMLGNHVLEAIVQANEDFRDTAGRIGYLNRSGRWNWGGFYQYVPLVTGGIARGSTTIDGQPVFVEQEVRDRQVGQQVQGVLEYPISRSQRFEFGAGLSHFSFNRTVRTNVFNQSGQLISQTERSESAAPLTLWQSAAAFVTDSAVFGVTGPLLGTRSRFEVAPTFGDVDYTTVVLDARRYVMPIEPFTIAGRILHVGRYGSDADSGRLSPLFLGFPTFVRGYDIYSFDPHDCDPNACINLDDLEGSRLLVANVEVRAPLVGMFKGRIDYGHVPVDLIGFYDAGIAWRSSAGGPSSSFSDRPWVKSAGAGVRVNAFGFAVLELSAVHAFDRPRDKWQFLFALQPGF